MCAFNVTVDGFFVCILDIAKSAGLCDPAKPCHPPVLASSALCAGAMVLQTFLIVHSLCAREGVFHLSMDDRNAIPEAGLHLYEVGLPLGLPNKGVVMATACRLAVMLVLMGLGCGDSPVCVRL